jgi:hypothetical protein
MECNKATPGIYLSYFVQGLILLNVGYSISIGNAYLATTTFFAFFLTVIPYVIEKNKRICLPWGVNVLICIAVYLHVAGHISEFYIVFSPYYDKIAHLVSSITISSLGFSVVLIVDRFSGVRLTRFMVALSIVALTMALGAIWEIYEFAFDQLLGMQLQKGLDDTMYDLIFDLCGALIIAVIGYFYLRERPKEEISERLILEDPKKR